MDEASEKKKLQDQIFGIIERITFHNPENGFTVAKIKQPRKKELTTLVGVLPVLQPGENVRCFGQWKQNPSHGIQFEVSECQIEAPADLEGIKRYLASGMVQGIGPVYAEKIVKKFGLQTLEIIDLSPDLLLEIEGLGEKRVEKIKSCWSAQKNIREVMIFLQSYGISPVFAQKVFKIYAEETKEVILANPYCLAKEIRGIGFKTADDIGQKLGFALHSNQRLDAGIEYVLQELSGEGHTCYPLESFLTKAQEILGVETSLLSERISMLEQEKIIIVKEGFIWSKSLYLAETGIAREIQRLLKERCSIRVIDVERALAWVEGQLRLELALHQKEAIQKSLQEKLHIITGGPGTGKSTIIKAILTITGMLTKRIILAAPTGRAAKRMTEITKKEASTIHSLLQYDFANGGFKRNREYPLDCDLLIVDEASMIDTSLMYHLLKAIPSGARVIFVGDIHQLPSVGPGNVLKDLIESEKIPITCLTEIFRQAAGSKIITNAHRILKGEFPDLRSEGGKSDFFFIKAQDPEQIKQTILNLVLHRLPRRYSLDPIVDIQVLAPMKKGGIGIQALNVALQECLNPHKEAIYYGGFKFSVGDKVMQVRNNYNKEVFNGDIGTILNIDTLENKIVIRFDNKNVDYFIYELDEITLAYAISIHKFQGSESPCIILPLHPSHFMMLHRNLFYTGVTRGKRLVILVGSPQAIGMAVNNDEVKKRFTKLKEYLRNQ